jgi:O-antigen/teichoic acid export membrane protein
VIKNIINKYFSKGSFAKDVFTLFSGSLIAQLISILFSPVLSRIYTPEDYGLFALYFSVLSILIVIAPLRYEMAIMIPKEEGNAIKIANIAFIFIFLFSIFTLIISVLFNGYIAAALGNPAVSGWLYFIPPGLILTGCYQVFNYYLNRNKEYKTISVSKIAQNSVNSLSSFGFGLMKFNVGGLIYGSLLGQFFSALVLIKKVKLSVFFKKENFKMHELKSLSREHKEFPLYSLPTAILDVFSLQLPIILITHFFGTSEVGHYSFAMRVLTLPITLIGASVAQVFYQKISSVVNEGGDAKRLIRKTWLNLIYIGILPMLILIFGAPGIFSFVFGDKWHMAGIVAMIMSPMLFCMFVSAPTSSAYLVFKLQKYSLFFGIAVLLYRPIALFLGYYLNDFMIGLKILVLMEILQILLYNYLLWKKIGKIYHNR